MGPFVAPIAWICANRTKFLRKSEGWHNGTAAVLKTAARKGLGVRVPRLPQLTLDGKRLNGRASVHRPKLAEIRSRSQAVPVKREGMASHARHIFIRTSYAAERIVDLKRDRLRTIDRHDR